MSKRQHYRLLAKDAKKWAAKMVDGSDRNY